MGFMLYEIGKAIARYLQKPIPEYEPFTRSDPDALRATLRPGDVLLVEGNNRISGVIKYLTQSTWSHAALYIGSIPGKMEENGEPHVLVEVDMSVGVISAPLTKYLDFHTRVCRPVNLSAEDCRKLCAYAVERIGCGYDLKNIIDLLRYLVPLPVPQRWRRRMIAIGSGDPTRLICSTLIAQAFEAIRYPILPRVTLIENPATRREILHIRHSSLYAPRDFDISPFFQVVKPTIETGFNYKHLNWSDLTSLDGDHSSETRPSRLIRREPSKANCPLEEKVDLRAAEVAASENHFARLREGRPESIDSSFIASRRATGSQAHSLPHLFGRLSG